MERPKSLERSHAGCEEIGPEDTFDGDYGRLLDQAYRVKVLASPSVPSWNQIAEWLRQMQQLREITGFAA